MGRCSSRSLKGSRTPAERRGYRISRNALALRRIRAAGGRAAVFLGLRRLRAALDAAGPGPGMELVGVALVFVAHDRVELRDQVAAFQEQCVDRARAFVAFEVVGLLVLVRVVDGFVVGAEVFHEVGLHLVVGEVFAERGFGGLLLRGVGLRVFEQGEDGVRVGEERVLRVGGVGRGGVVADGEGGVGEADGAGGAGDILEVEAEGLEEGGLGDFGAELADFGFAETGEDLIDFVEEGEGEAAGGEVGGVLDAEGADALEALFAKDVSVVHDMMGVDWIGYSALRGSRFGAKMDER